VTIIKGATGSHDKRQSRREYLLLTRDSSMMCVLNMAANHYHRGLSLLLIYVRCTSERILVFHTKAQYVVS
jgi:hypothetical protein